MTIFKVRILYNKIKLQLCCNSQNFFFSSTFFSPVVFRVKCFLITFPCCYLNEFCRFTRETSLNLVRKVFRAQIKIIDSKIILLLLVSPQATLFANFHLSRYLLFVENSTLLVAIKNPRINVLSHTKKHILIQIILNLGFFLIELVLKADSEVEVGRVQMNCFIVN